MAEALKHHTQNTQREHDLETANIFYIKSRQKVTDWNTVDWKTRNLMRAALQGKWQIANHLNLIRLAEMCNTSMSWQRSTVCCRAVRQSAGPGKNRRCGRWEADAAEISAAESDVTVLAEKIWMTVLLETGMSALFARLFGFHAESFEDFIKGWESD